VPDDDFFDTAELERLRAALDSALKAAMHELLGHGTAAVPPFIALLIASYGSLTGIPITLTLASVLECYEVNFAKVVGKAYHKSSE
jgi:hypothetical protein